MIIFWTPTKIKLLKQYWADGLSAAQIAVKLKATRNAVIGKVHRLGLPSRASNVGYAAVRAVKKETPKLTAVVKELKGTRKTTTISKALPPRPIVNPVVPVGDACAATMALIADSCRWPMGDPCTDRFMYCDKKKLGDYPYCDEHCRKAYHEFGMPRHRRK